MVGERFHQFDGLGEFVLGGRGTVKGFVDGCWAGDVELYLGQRVQADEAFEQGGIPSVRLYADREAALGELLHQFDEVIFLSRRALGKVEAGNPAVQQVAARDRAFEGVPGQQVGDDFPGALLDDRAVVEQRKLHAFGVAVDGLAVGAVEGVECLGISLEIHGFVSDLMFGEKAFDDFAPQAVGCGIQGDAHLCAPVMPESRQKGLLCKRRFAAGYGRKKRRNPSERGSSEFLPLPIPGSGTENCYRCYFFRKKFEKNRLRGGNQPHSASSCSSSSFSS